MSRPRHTEAVETAHYAVAGRVVFTRGFKRVFKRPHIHFAYGLLVREGAHAYTVGFLVVEEEMFEIAYNAL